MASHQKKKVLSYVVTDPWVTPKGNIRENGTKSVPTGEAQNGGASALLSKHTHPQLAPSEWACKHY